MLLPSALPDSLLFLGALGLFVGPLLLNMLRQSALILTPLLNLLRLSSLVYLPLLLVSLTLLLLSALWLSVLVLSLLLLNLLRLPLLLLCLGSLLRALLFGRALTTLVLPLTRMIALFALLLLLSIGRSSNCEKQCQNGCAGDSNCFHGSYL